MLCREPVQLKMLEVISVICETKSEGRGAAGKVPVLDILKSGGRVYTKVIPTTKGKTLMGIMQDLIVLDSTLCVRTPINRMTCWMCRNSNAIASTILNVW